MFIKSTINIDNPIKLRRLQIGQFWVQTLSTTQKNIRQNIITLNIDYNPNIAAGWIFRIWHSNRASFNVGSERPEI